MAYMYLAIGYLLGCNFSCFLEGGSPLPPGFVAVVGRRTHRSPSSKYIPQKVSPHHLITPNIPLTSNSVQQGANHA